jgi:autotransporter translocation and assembly factor TamB
MGNTPARLTVGRTAGQLQTGILRRVLSGAVELHDATLRRKAYQATIHELRAVGGIDSGGVFVETAALRGDRITATAAATAARGRHAVSADFDPSLLGVVVDELSFLGGAAHVEGELHGDLANPVLDGRLTIRHGAIGTHVLGDLDTHVTRRDATLRFDELQLVEEKGRVSGAVELNVLREVPIHGDLEWHMVDLEELLKIIGEPVPFRNRFSATTSVRGALDPLDLDVRGQGTLRAADPQAENDRASFQLSGRIHSHDLDARLDVEQPERNHVKAQVLIDGDRFGGQVNVAATDLAALSAVLPRPVQALALTGRGDATAEFGGSTEHPTVGGSATFHDLTVVGTPVSGLTGDFQIAAGALRTRATRADTPAGSAELTGALALRKDTRNDWRLDLRGLDTDLVLGLVAGLADLQMPLNGGTLNGALVCVGPWEQLQAQAELHATALRVGVEPLERVDVNAAVAWPRWNGSIRATRAGGDAVRLVGSGERGGNLQVRIESDPLDLSTWRGGGRRRLRGTLAVQGEVSGSLDAPSGSIHLQAADVSAAGHTLGDVALRAEGRSGEWTFSGDAFAATLRLHGSLRTSEPFPYTLAVQWNDADLTKLLSDDASLVVVSSGALDLSGAVRSLQTSSGSLQVRRFDLRRDQAAVSAPQPIRVVLDRGQFRIESLALSADGARMSISGHGRVPAEIDIDVAGEGDLVLLEVVGRPFYSARGQFDVSAHVARSPAAGWRLRGRASLRNAALDLGLPVSFTDVNANFGLRGNNVLVEHLAGRAGGGEFSVAGRVHLRRGPVLTWALRDVSLSFPEWLEERISGNGRVYGGWKSLTVSGDVEVQNALYDKRLELTALLPWFKEQVAPAPRVGAPAVEMRLDVRVRAPDGLFVDNNFAKAELAADLRIAGTAATPQLLGSVEVLNGEVTIGSRVFTISGGSAEFRDPRRINPILNFSAESQIVTAEEQYTVRVAVSGTADEPRVKFTADDPALSQNDVLSLVAFGKTTAQAQRESGGVSVGDVFGLIPGEYGTEVRQGVRSWFGVDRFEVEPAYVRNTGAVEPRVTIGKDITERLRALASSSFGAEGRNSMQLEYRVTGRISLLGTWESATQSEAGAFGGDIKFRYEFRRVPLSLFSTAPRDGL